MKLKLLNGKQRPLGGTRAVRKIAARVTDSSERPFGLVITESRKIKSDLRYHAEDTESVVLTMGEIEELYAMAQESGGSIKIDTYTEIWYEIQLSAPGTDDWFTSTETADTESSIRTKQALMVAVTDGDTRIVKKTLIEEVVA